MKSITELEPEQREALMFWIKDSCGKDPIIISDPHGYLSKTGGLTMEITQETRRESYQAAKQDGLARRRVILEILTEHRDDLTAREVSAELHRRSITPSDERNYAAPRLTELKEAGKVHAVGKKPCAHSGRNVAVWAVRGCN